jgi:hypothetical protein
MTRRTFCCSSKAPAFFFSFVLANRETMFSMATIVKLHRFTTEAEKAQYDAAHILLQQQGAGDGGAVDAANDDTFGGGGGGGGGDDDDFQWSQGTVRSITFAVVFQPNTHSSFPLPFSITFVFFNDTLTFMSCVYPFQSRFLFFNRTLTLYVLFLPFSITFAVFQPNTHSSFECFFTTRRRRWRPCELALMNFTVFNHVCCFSTITHLFSLLLY